MNSAFTCVKCQSLTSFFQLVHLVRVRVFQIPSFHFLPFRTIRRTSTSAAGTQFRDLFRELLFGTYFRDLVSGPIFRDLFSGTIFGTYISGPIFGNYFRDLSFGTQIFRDSYFSGLKFFGTQNFPGLKSSSVHILPKVKFFGDSEFSTFFRIIVYPCYFSSHSYKSR